jgi:hypothetical protein
MGKDSAANTIMNQIKQRDLTRQKILVKKMEGTVDHDLAYTRSFNSHDFDRHPLINLGMWTRITI